MEKQKKKLTISGKPKKNFVSQQNFESKKKYCFQNLQIILKKILKLSL